MLDLPTLESMYDEYEHICDQVVKNRNDEINDQLINPPTCEENEFMNVEKQHDYNVEKIGLDEHHILLILL